MKPDQPLSWAALHILLALSGRELHGYAIMQEVEEMTGGAVTMGPGTLYGSIKRMLEDGLIERSDRRPAPRFDDARRRYYRLTEHGARVLAIEARRLAGLLEVARKRRVALGGFA
jgi:DNA-binding PadR family transcriptional regulator